METKIRKPVRGYFYIAAATFCWGIAASMGRAAFTGRLPGLHALRPIDPLILSQSRATFSFLVLLPVLGMLRGRRLRLPAADLGQIFLIGILGVAASNYFYYLAIQRTNVATAIIVQYTAPIWVLLYTVARGLQKPTLQRVAAVGLAVTGIALVIGLFGGGGLRLDTIGVIAALLAAFSFAFYNIGGHNILARLDRWIVLLYTTCSASLFWIVVNPPWKITAAHYSGEQWLFLLLFSLISVLAPFSFYFAGTATSRADTGHRGQLSGACVFDRDRCGCVGRDRAALAGDRNSSGAGGDCGGATAGSQVGGGTADGRAY